jgi:hypothetical protein
VTNRPRPPLPRWLIVAASLSAVAAFLSLWFSMPAAMLFFFWLAVALCLRIAWYADGVPEGLGCVGELLVWLIKAAVVVGFIFGLVYGVVWILHWMWRAS